MSIESALRELVEAQTAPLRARLEALERERLERETRLLSMRQVAERHGIALGTMRGWMAQRRANGLEAAVVPVGRRLLVDEAGLLEWLRRRSGRRRA